MPGIKIPELKIPKLPKISDLLPDDKRVITLLSPVVTPIEKATALEEKISDITTTLASQVTQLEVHKELVADDPAEIATLEAQIKELKELAVIELAPLEEQLKNIIYTLPTKRLLEVVNNLIEETATDIKEINQVVDKLKFSLDPFTYVEPYFLKFTAEV